MLSFRMGKEVSSRLVINEMILDENGIGQTGSISNILITKSDNIALTVGVLYRFTKKIKDVPQ